MRRLRENAFMEAEVGNDGAVTVEGHHVGELQGFRFTPDAVSEGQDGKAVRAAAQKALAGEYDRRAERFFNAPNGDLALGADGLVRWLGAPVAAISAGDDPLRPRIVLLADEQLTGPARDKVAARAERYITYQVSTVLKPLADLGAGEGLEGTAKGIAYRLYENFGLIQRRDIAEDVRSLDQDARAALRRLGVRFGAYHIFVPALIKPAPAHLMTLLWATAKDARDRPGYGEVPQLLATGRTSARPEAGFDPVFYALAGYRLLGSRAVRVDILERLADLIRPALSWKPGTSKRPEGAFDGRAFIVTPAMMSILGATAQDMDEILKGLGYRSNGMEAGAVDARLAEEDAAAAARAAATSAPPAAPAEDAQPAAETTDAEASDETASETEAVTGEVEDTAQPAAEAPAEPDEAPSEPESVSDATDEPSSDEAPEAAPVAEDASPAPTSASSPAEDKPAEEPKIVQLWRPSRGDRERGPRRGGREGRGENRTAGAEGGERVAREGERRGPRPGRGGPNRERREGDKPNENRFGGQRSGGPGGGKGAGGGKPRFDKPPRSDDAPRRFEKPKVADPDSPFAKLAALKEQLKK